MTAFLGGLFIFLAIHSVRIVAPQVRDRLASAYGEGAWKGVYSLIALASFVWMTTGYGDAKTVLGILWSPPFWARHVAVVLMLPALIAVAAAYAPPSRIKAWLKHPMLVAIKIWALAHLLSNGLGVHVVLFGAFLVWAIVDRISVKRRGTPDPIAPTRWTGDITAVAVGVVAWVALIAGVHQWLFGVAPIG